MWLSTWRSFRQKHVGWYYHLLIFWMVQFLLGDLSVHRSCIRGVLQHHTRLALPPKRIFFQVVICLGGGREQRFLLTYHFNFFFLLLFYPGLRSLPLCCNRLFSRHFLALDLFWTALLNDTKCTVLPLLSFLSSHFLICYSLCLEILILHAKYLPTLYSHSSFKLHFLKSVKNNLQLKKYSNYALRSDSLLIIRFATVGWIL